MRKIWWIWWCFLVKKSGKYATQLVKIDNWQSSFANSIFLLCDFLHNFQKEELICFGVWNKCHFWIYVCTTKLTFTKNPVCGNKMLTPNEWMMFVLTSVVKVKKSRKNDDVIYGRCNRSKSPYVSLELYSTTSKTNLVWALGRKTRHCFSVTFQLWIYS